MDVQVQIDDLIQGQPASKREDMLTLHRQITTAAPGCRLWFVDGRNDEGKVVANPSVGYGVQTMTYAAGDTREFYRVGVSPNVRGISVYLMGLHDRRWLPDTYGARLGKAKVTGYCISFRSLRDVDAATLQGLISDHMRSV